MRRWRSHVHRGGWCWGWRRSLSRGGEGATGELTLESETALQRGLDWLEKNQGAAGNWESNDTGLVSTLGALASMAAGHCAGPRQVRAIGPAARVRDQERQARGVAEHRQPATRHVQHTLPRLVWAGPGDDDGPRPPLEQRPGPGAGRSSRPRNARTAAGTIMRGGKPTATI